jgi:hypothetical protein
MVFLSFGDLFSTSRRIAGRICDRLALSHPWAPLRRPS